MRFRDREEAGKKLAEALARLKGKDAIVYALPRGGVVVAAEIAKKLEAPLDIVITRKIGYPFNPEFAIGAVAESGEAIWNEEETAAISRNWLESEVKKERTEAARRRELYLKGKEPVSAKGKIAVLVDDGVATGLTMILAVRELKKHNPAKIIVAVPVAPRDFIELLKKEGGTELVALSIPENYLGAVGAYYENFWQVEDDEVIALLNE